MGCQDSPTENMRKAHVMFTNGHHDQAAKLFEKVLETTPDHAPALEGLGDVAYERGEPKTATQWYDRAFTLTPDSSVLLHKLVVSLVGAGETARAKSIIEEAIQKDSNNVVALFSLASLLDREQDSKAAEAMYLRVLREDPAHAASRYALGNLMFKDGRLPEAKIQYDRLIQDGSDSLGAYGLARIAAKDGDLKAVGRFLGQVLDAGPAHPENILKDPVLGPALSDPSLSGVRERLVAPTTSSTAKSGKG